MINRHYTVYHGFIERHNGYNGARSVVHLVEDMSEGETVYAVYPSGFYRYADTIHDALERSDVIAHHAPRGEQ